MEDDTTAAAAAQVSQQPEAANCPSQAQLCSNSGSTSGAHNHQQQAMPLELLLQAAVKQGHKAAQVPCPTSLQQQQKLVAGLSHLHLEDFQLTELLSLRLCPKLQVLYIFGNQLTSIESIASSRLLTHLYCHNNKLASLQGVQHLPLLQKLYVQGNCLTSVDCLSKAQHLQELHVSDQRAWAPAAYVGPEQLAPMYQQPSQRQLCPQQSQQHLLQQRSCQQLAQQKSQQQQLLQQRSQQQLAQQQQQPGQQPRKRGHPPALLFNDGCIMQQPSSSTPSTPSTTSTPRAHLSTEASAQTAGASGGCTAESSMAVSDTTVSSSMPSTPGGLWFEPASLAAIAGSLRVLAAAACGITDPRPLAVLTRLRVLDLAGNAVADLAVLQPVLGSLAQLQDLDLRRNPCVHSISKYRDCLILAASDTLEQLDGEEVKSAHRTFLQALRDRKAKACQHEQQQQARQEQQEQLAQQVSKLRIGLGDAAAAAAAAAGSQQEGSVGFAISAGNLTPRTHAQLVEIAAGSRGPLTPRTHAKLVAIAAGHHAPLTPRTHAALIGGLEPPGPTVSPVKLQLPFSAQACRAGAVRPPAAAGFKPSARRGPRAQAAAAAAAARAAVAAPAAAGALTATAAQDSAAEGIAVSSCDVRCNGLC